MASSGKATSLVGVAAVADAGDRPVGGDRMDENGNEVVDSTYAFAIDEIAVAGNSAGQESGTTVVGA